MRRSLPECAHIPFASWRVKKVNVRSGTSFMGTAQFQDALSSQLLPGIKFETQGGTLEPAKF